MTNNAMTVDEILIPEVWAAKVLGKLSGYLNLINTVNRDYEPEVAQFGDTINITKLGSFTANDKVKGTNVTRQKATESNVQVTLDKHKEITFAPEDIARALAKTSVVSNYLETAALTIAEAVEASITAKYAEAGLTVNASTLSDPRASLREARRKLITSKIPKNTPVFGYVDEFFVEKLPLTDAAALGASAPVIDGSIAKLGGVNLFETQMVATEGSPTNYHDLVYVRDAIALVVRPLPSDAESFGGAKQAVVYDPQTGLAIRVTMSYDANALAPQITLDVLWGVKVLRPEFLVDMHHT